MLIKGGYSSRIGTILLSELSRAINNFETYWKRAPKTGQLTNMLFLPRRVRSEVKGVGKRLAQKQGRKNSMIPASLVTVRTEMNRPTMLHLLATVTPWY